MGVGVSSKRILETFSFDNSGISFDFRSKLINSMVWQFSVRLEQRYAAIVTVFIRRNFHCKFNFIPMIFENLQQIIFIRRTPNWWKELFLKYLPSKSVGESKILKKVVKNRYTSQLKSNSIHNFLVIDFGTIRISFRRKFWNQLSTLEYILLYSPSSSTTLC